jgi:uncharacterized protein YdeI (YjbR/CyaY-like superfamily)
LSEENPRYFGSIEEWRSWLSMNHTEEDAIWIILQKKTSNRPGITYEESVMEAVAHGWIDGKMKRINNDEFMQRFSPRRSSSRWSISNRRRAELLMEEGRMMPAGMRTVEEAKSDGRWENAYSTSRGPVDPPDDLLDALKENKLALENFNAFPPYTRFMYIHWVNEAKRQDARMRRIYTVVERSKENLKPGIDLKIIKKEA